MAAGTWSETHRRLGNADLSRLKKKPVLQFIIGGQAGSCGGDGDRTTVTRYADILRTTNWSRQTDSWTLLAIHFSLAGFIVDLFLVFFVSLHRILFAPLNRHLCIPKSRHVLPNCRLCTRAIHFSKPHHYYACRMGTSILSDHLLSPIFLTLRARDSVLTQETN